MNNRTGQKHTPETIERIRTSLTGKTLPATVRQKIAATKRIDWTGLDEVVLQMREAGARISDCAARVGVAASTMSVWFQQQRERVG